MAAGYLAVAWLLVQVTATILPAFGLPVWALQWTPEGMKLDRERRPGLRASFRLRPPGFVN